MAKELLQNEPTHAAEIRPYEHGTNTRQITRSFVAANPRDRDTRRRLQPIEALISFAANFNFVSSSSYIVSQSKDHS